MKLSLAMDKLTVGDGETKKQDYADEADIHHEVQLTLILPDGSKVEKTYSTGDTILNIKKMLHDEHGFDYKAISLMRAEEVDEPEEPACEESDDDDGIEPDTSTPRPLLDPLALADFPDLAGASAITLVVHKNRVPTLLVTPRRTPAAAAAASSSSSSSASAVKSDAAADNDNPLHQRIKVVFTLPDGSEWEHMLSAGDTVLNAKKILNEQKALPYRGISIHHDEQELLDPYTLNDFPFVKADQTLNLLVRRAPVPKLMVTPRAQASPAAAADEHSANEVYRRVKVVFTLPDQSVWQHMVSIGDTVLNLKKILNEQKALPYRELSLHHDELELLDPLTLNDFPFVATALAEEGSVVLKVTRSAVPKLLVTPRVRAAARESPSEEDIHSQVTIVFTLPDKSSVEKRFSSGDTVLNLKKFLEDSKQLTIASTTLKFNGKALLDPLCLNDFPDIATAAK
eukprot:CAMPEP_0174236976 /NCGR_PEP_ID=MMETSP0417-20130205/6366_1 /TAXON_ID=242541 /ORGANISM="Mayorella sp, Strain BSH-02190019" /LENGTH=455 /DNA_ID=CAMNT_0015315681 /DNA_START=72 /DNA_END=1436 /DNA_ORIENTATION=+